MTRRSLSTNAALGSSATDHSTTFLAWSLPGSVVCLALRASLVGRSRGSLMAPDADTCFDIPVVIPPRARFLILRMRPDAFLTSCCTAYSPIAAAIDADTMFLAKRPHHSTRSFATPVRRFHSSTRRDHSESQRVLRAQSILHHH